MSDPATLILASQSPRRRELLTQAGFRFDVLPANIDESRRDDEAPAAYVERLALEKARAVHALRPDALILAADTTVDLDGDTLNKPANRDDARRMLLSLSGREHTVHTGLAVVSAHIAAAHVETTRVTFSAIDAADLEHYLATGEPMDKAGAYGIQGFAARWIPRIEGDYFNVVGLPIAATVRLLREAYRRPNA